MAFTGVPQQQREARMLGEWVAERFPRAERIIFNARLGPLPKELNGRPLPWAKRQMLGVFNRYADALVLSGGKLHLVECAIRAAVEKVAQLEIYAQLLPETEELEELRGLTPRPILVAATEDSAIRRFCEGKGVEFVVFRPAWVEAYLADRAARKRGPVASGLPA